MENEINNTKKSNDNVVKPLSSHKQKLTETHTDEILEIITRVPSWILRWGITLFFSILIIIIVISGLVKYPDTNVYKFEITSSDISTSVVADFSGRLLKLLIKKGDIVNKNQALALIEKLDDSIKYTLYATRTGKVSFATIIQPGDFVKTNQELFVIYPRNEVFFGLIKIPLIDITKIKEGQDVLIHLKGYSNEQTDLIIKGKITEIADEPVNGYFTLKVRFIDYQKAGKTIELKNWMNADAEIITQDITLFKRITTKLFKSIN